MRKMSALFVAAVAGTAIAAPTAQTAFNRVVHEAEAKLGVATANTVRDMNGNIVSVTGVSSRVEVEAYNTLDDPNGLATAGRNLWWSCLGGYDGSGDGFIFFVIFGSDCSQTDPLFGDPNCLTFTDDNGTPTDPSDDTIVITDVIFDDYHANPADLPGGIDDLYDLAEVQTNVLVRNPETFDINNTPTNPNDDIPDIRTNTFSNLFFGVTDDNGTPSDPTDDGVAFNTGYGADFTWAADAFTNTRLTIDLRGGGFQVAGRGLTVYDWQNVAVFGVTGDNGLYLAPCGGDSDPSTPGFGTDGSGPIPGSATLIQNAGPIDLEYWLFGSSTQADPAFDGDPSTTSYEDVLFASPALVDWTFNGDAAGDFTAPHQLPFVFVYDVEDTSCPIDYASPTDPTTPDGILTGADFFAFLSLFSAGDLQADLAGPTDPTTPDGNLTGADFFRFLDLFSNGCVL